MPLSDGAVVVPSDAEDPPRPALTLESSDNGPGQGTPQGTPSPLPKSPRGPRRVDTTPPAPPDPTDASAYVAVQRDPDHWAKVLDLSKRLGLPDAQFVDRNFDALSKTDSQQRATADSSAVSPTLQAWLANPDNATIAQHEVAPLGRVDRGARMIAGHPPAPGDDNPLGAIGTAEATGYADLASSSVQWAVAHNLVDAHRGAKFVADMNLRAKDLRDQAPDYVKQYQAAAQAVGGDWEKATPDFIAGKVLENSNDATQALVGYANGTVRTAGELLDRLAVAARNIKGFTVAQFQSLASMVPFLAGSAAGGAVGAAVGSVVPGLGTAVGGGIGVGLGTFAAMYPTSVGSEITQSLAARGIDVTNADALEKAYNDPAIMGDIRARAEKAGISNAAVVALFAPFAGKLLAAPGEAAAKDALELSGRGISDNAAQAAASVAREAAQRATPLAEKVARGAGDVAIQAGGVATAGAAAQVAKGEKADPHQALQTFLDMLGVGAASEALGASRRQFFDPNPTKAALDISDQTTDAARAVRDAQGLAEVGQAVKEAPTTASVPDRLKSLIETATGGQDASTVYFQRAEWDQHWEGQGRSPAVAAADIMGDGGKAYDAAKSTDAALAIPLGDYVSKVGPTADWDALLPLARTKSDGMSLGEAHEYLQSLPATLKELADEAAIPAGEPKPMDVQAAQVRSDVEEQLMKAGIRPNAARAQAQLYEAAFRTLGERAGIGPRELFNRYGLTIGRGPLEPTPEARAKIETAKKAAAAAATQGENIAAAKATLEAQGTEEGTSRAKFLDTIAPSFSDENEAARLQEEEGSPYRADLPRPRTASGRLKNLSKATNDELANEYMLLTDANAQENTAPSAIETQYGETWTGIKPAAMKALGRIAARAKTLAKLEAEMTARGMDPIEAYMAGAQNRTNAEPTGFEFQQGRTVSDAVLDDVITKLSDTREGGDVLSQLLRTITPSGDMDADLRAAARKYLESATPDVVRELTQPAYHGSPHVFDEFSLHNIGGGEGNQSYGWGLYFAGKKKIAEYYREQLAGARLPGLDQLRAYFTPGRIVKGYGGYDRVIAFHEKDGDWTGVTVHEVQKNAAGEWVDVPGERDRTHHTFPPMKEIESALGPQPKAGRLYKVDIPEDERYLNWDRSFSQQPAAVRAALEPLRVEYAASGGERGAYIPEQQTGRDTYREVQQLERAKLAAARDTFSPVGNFPELASRTLGDLGIAGIKYRAGQMSGTDTDASNYVVFDAKLVKILEHEQAMKGADEPRGRITFGDGKPFRIELLKNANRSTFIHETGHFYTEVLGDLAKRPEATEQIKADWAELRKFAGAEGDTPLSEPQHEKIARGFEAYLMEGKAPSAALRSAFFRMKNWLLDIYENIRGLSRDAGFDVQLTPEVRQVFDRLLATREEIKAAEAEQNIHGLFDDPLAIGMTPEQAASYSRAVQDAHESAEEELTTRLMKSIRREESAEWKRWRDPIEADVTKQIDATPTYQAIENMRRGTKPDGSPLDDGTVQVKLNTDVVKEMLGDEWSKLQRRGVTTADGVHPDVAAEMFGFGSGREMLDAIKDAPPRKQAIKAQTDARMQAEHGEPMTDVRVRELTTQSLHDEKRVQLLRKELEYLASDHLAAFKGLVRGVSRAIPPSEEVRRQAETIVGGKKIREIRPDLFEKAATRASIEAREALLRGDVDGAFTAKRKELLATEVYRVAQDAKDALDKDLETFKKVFRPDDKISETHEMNLVSAARSILASVGIGKSTKPPEEFVSQIREYDPEAADYVDAQVAEGMALTRGVKDYRDLSQNDFQTMSTYVKALWELSRSAMQVTVDGEKMNRQVIQGELMNRISAIRGTSERPTYTQARTKWEGIKAGLLSFKSVSRKVEHWMRAMDAGETSGIFRKYLWNRISESSDDYRVADKAMREEYAGFLKELSGRGDDDFPISRAKIPAPELNYTFAGHNELLGAMLHTGNKSNLTKNLVGRHWARVLEDGTLDTTAWDAFTERMRKEGMLTQAHYDWMQGVWDRAEAYKPGAQKAFRAMFGRYFPEVTKDGFSVTFADGETANYQGGYYPAKPDKTIVPDAQARADRDALTGTSTAYMFPSVWKGFTIKRMEGYMRPLEMDASAVPNSYSSVLQFTHLAPAVREIGRVVMNPALREEMFQLDPTVTSDMLVPWLQRAGAQRGEQSPEGGDFWRNVNKMASKVRNSAAMQIMTANTTVLLEQATHFPSVLVRFRQPADVAALGRALWNYTTNHREMADNIAELSKMMATRESAGLDVAKEEANKILLDPTVFQNVRSFTKAHARFLMQGVQSIQDHIVWQAAYDRAMETMDPREAVRHADSMVRELLGSYSPEDISRIEAGTPLQKLFTMFSGFYLTKANVQGTEVAIAKQLGVSQNKGRLASAVFFGLMVPAAMGLAIRNKVAGQPVVDQENDEGSLHALLRFFGQSSGEMLTREVPFAGSAISSLEYASAHHGSVEMLSSPALKMVGDAAQAVTIDAPNALKNNAITKHEMTDFFTLLGLLTDLPLRPVGGAVSTLREKMGAGR